MPVLDGAEWHKLIDAIPTDVVRDLRDRVRKVLDMVTPTL